MPDPTRHAWLIRNAEIDGKRADLRLRDGRIEAVAPALPDEPGESRIDARGGALLPGLHDHHIHLLALAASLESVRCGPPEVTDQAGLSAALHAAAADAPAERWLRGVGYHESVAGDLERHALDRLGPDRPIRIQHRSGARWILNSRAIALLGEVPADDRPPGLELDRDRQPSGRLDRADAWLRAHLGDRALPDLARVGALLTSFGVTSVCDATVANDAQSLAILEQASRRGDLPQRLRVMGRAGLPLPGAPRVERGALKVMLDENALPDRSDLLASIVAAHHDERGVAFHCVTRAELVFALSALEEAGCSEADRIEHASIAPPDCARWLARLPLTVVTQPNFVGERGDAYLSDVAEADRPWLYRGRGLLDAGVALGGGTDAPFGDPDPWRAMRAAVERRTDAGAPLGPQEALSPEEALGLFTAPLAMPGGTPRRLCAGASADLCLLDRSWAAARGRLNALDVAGVWIAGERVNANR